MKDLILFRKSISNKSGTGQLIGMQVNKLRENNLKFQLYCNKGFFKAWLMSRVWPKRAKIANRKLILDDMNNSVIIDHDGSLLNADFTFVHNLFTHENNPYLDWMRNGLCHIIANSNYTKNKLHDLSIENHRISVVYPGYNKYKFNIETKNRYQKHVRKKFSITDDKKVIGFITSGDFEKRGLIHFLDICLQINQQCSNVAFFVLGAHKLPNEHANHPTLKLKNFHYKPKNSQPEYWLSLIDIFVYPAKLEEFGMVIPEALSMGIPVLTTTNVGASEILPESYQPWMHDHIDIQWFVEKTLHLLNDTLAYDQLSKASLEAVNYDHVDYATRTLDVIRSNVDIKTKN